MKSRGKKRLLLTSLLMLVVMLFGMGLTAQAAREMPNKVRSYPKSVGYINLKLEKGEYIQITAKKNLKAKVTDEHWNTSSTSEDNKDSSATIAYYGTKKGKFSISFDIFSAATGQKTGSHTVTVFIKDDDPFKKVAVNGKDYYTFETYLTTAKSVKFKVKMNKGYKFKKLEVGKYSAPEVTDERSSTSYAHKTTENELVYKTVKNGSKITLGTRGRYYLSESDYHYSDETPYKYHYLSASMSAYTAFRVTYIDKWTKEETTRTFSLSKMIKK